MIRGFAIAVFLVALAYMLALLLFIATLPQTPSLQPEADGIVALTGGGARLDTAVGLFEKGVGQRLLISGVDRATTKETLDAVAHGGTRFACCADIGYAAEDTHGNAVEAAEWAHGHQFHSIVIVTARYHMPRALREFQSMMPDVTLLPYAIEQGESRGWWSHPASLMRLNREFVKYLASVTMTTVSAFV